VSEGVVLQHAEKAGTDFLIYTGNFCGYCNAAKRLFENKKLTFTEYNYDQHAGLRQDVVAATGHRTVPVIFDLRGDDVMFIGGFDETNSYLKKSA
jgi:glutaredoxin 3